MIDINGDEAGRETEAIDSAHIASVRRLASVAAGSFGLSVIQTALGTLTAIVLARVMGVTDYGTYALVVATVAILGVPAILGVDRLLIRDLAVYVGDASYGLARGLVSRAVQQTLLVSVGIAVGAGLVCSQAHQGAGRARDRGEYNDG